MNSLSENNLKERIDIDSEWRDEAPGGVGWQSARPIALLDTLLRHRLCVYSERMYCTLLFFAYLDTCNIQKELCNMRKELLTHFLAMRVYLLRRWVGSGYLTLLVVAFRNPYSYTSTNNVMRKNWCLRSVSRPFFVTPVVYTFFKTKRETP